MERPTSDNIVKFRIGDDGFIEQREEYFPRVYWWGITRGSLLYAAIGRTSEEAYQAIADELLITVDRFLSVPTFAQIYTDDVQTVLTQKFGERKVVRLLAWSVTEWPTDYDNLSEEQLQHGVEHGWLNPDGSRKK